MAMSSPRKKYNTPVTTYSAIGMAWTPAEFVSATSLESISGYSALPTPAAAECTHRNRFAARKSGRGMPKPRYTSAFGISLTTSSLDPRGPSPSELVWARAKYTSQSGGASSRTRRSASFVNVQVRDTAFPSTTSSGIASIHRQADHVLPAAQIVDGGVDLLRRAEQPALERTQADEHEDDEDRRADALDVRAGADRRANCGDNPDGRGRR